MSKIINVKKKKKKLDDERKDHEAPKFGFFASNGQPQEF